MNALIRLFFDDVKNGRCPIQLTNPTHGDIKVQTGAALKQIVQTLQKNNEVGHFFPFVLTTRERNKWTFEHSIPNKKITLVIHLNAGVGGLTCSSSEIQYGVENQDKPLDLFLESNV